MTTQNSWAQVASTTPPPGAVQVTPEEFKTLKKNEVPPPKTDVKSDSSSVYSGGGWSGGGGDGTIAIFAIIGAVMLIAWVPYVVLLSYRGFKYPERYTYYSIISSQIMNIDHSNEDKKRAGVMSSARYTILSAELENETSDKKVPKNKSYGFNFEIGHFDFYDLNKPTGQKQQYHSLYWTVGPSFIWGDLTPQTLFPLFLKLDFTAGTSFHQDVDLILKAEFSFNAIVNKYYYLGLGGAGFYLYGREGKGIFNHVNDLSTQFFGTLGYIF